MLLERTIIFNGIAFNVGLPIQTEFTWNTWRFGYEYDFVYTDRGFVGFIVEARYVDAQLALQSPLDSEFTQAKGPVPAIGGIGRVYVHKRVSITGEVTGMKVPEIENYVGSFFDLDIYGTVNFTHNFGAQAGYRTLDRRVYGQERHGRSRDEWAVLHRRRALLVGRGDPRRQRGSIHAPSRRVSRLDGSSSAGRNAAAVEMVKAPVRSADWRGTSRSQTSPGASSRRAVHSPARHATAPPAPPCRMRSATGDEPPATSATSPPPAVHRPPPSVQARPPTTKSTPAGVAMARWARRPHADGVPGSTRVNARCSAVRARAASPLSHKRPGAGGQIDLAAGRARRLLHQRAGRHHLIGPAERDGDGAR